MVRYAAELPATMQAGRWATPVMVARYTRRLTARRSAAVQIADLGRQRRLRRLAPSLADDGYGLP